MKYTDDYNLQEKILLVGDSAKYHITADMGETIAMHSLSTGNKWANYTKRVIIENLNSGYWKLEGGAYYELY